MNRERFVDPNLVLRHGGRLEIGDWRGGGGGGVLWGLQCAQVVRTQPGIIIRDKPDIYVLDTWPDIQHPGIRGWRGHYDPNLKSRIGMNRILNLPDTKTNIWDIK